MGDAATPTQVIAKRVRELRTDRKWTAQQLAEKVTTTGVVWNRGTIAKLENGRRDAVSVEELFALAWAFGVPPIVLVLPDDPGAPYQLTPVVTTSAKGVFGWMTGAFPPVDAEQDEATARYTSSMPTYMRPSERVWDWDQQARNARRPQSDQQLTGPWWMGQPNEIVE